MESIYFVCHVLFFLIVQYKILRFEVVGQSDSGGFTLQAGCLSDPCLNNGTCTMINGVFQCLCPVGFSGFTCGEDIDECSDISLHFCLSTSVCVNTPGSYSCECLPAYTGTMCENTLSDTSSPTSTNSVSPTTLECTNFTDLLSNPSVILDDDITISYQESRTTTSSLYPFNNTRIVPAVSKEIFTVDFPEEPEFWVETLSIWTNENTEVEVIFSTSQLCKNHTDGSQVYVARNFSTTIYIKASTTYYVDLMAVKDDLPMACASQIVLQTKKITVVPDSSTFQVETDIYGCSLFQELLKDCVSHNLLQDPDMYNRTYVMWRPTKAAKQSLRSTGPGLVLHRYTNPTVRVNGHMFVQNVTILGNLYSAYITTDANSIFGLRERDATWLEVYPAVSTSMVLVMPGLVDSAEDIIVINLEIIGCSVSKTSVSSPTITTTTRNVISSAIPASFGTTSVPPQQRSYNTTTTTSNVLSSAIPASFGTTSVPPQHTSPPTIESTSSSSHTNSAMTFVAKQSAYTASVSSTAATYGSKTFTPVSMTETSTSENTTFTEATTMRGSPVPTNDTCCAITCSGYILSEDEIQEKIEELLKNLTIPKGHTAKARRRKISVDDERPSATAVGSFCGILVLTFTGSFIVLMDVDHMIWMYSYLNGET